MPPLPLQNLHRATLRSGAVGGHALHSSSIRSRPLAADRGATSRRSLDVSTSASLATTDTDEKLATSRLTDRAAHPAAPTNEVLCSLSSSAREEGEKVVAGGASTHFETSSIRDEDSAFGEETASSCMYSDVSQKDHNSVTIKSDTSVKDAAGAICKVLNRLASTFVTALQLEGSHESANRAVKALAVSRKYIKDGATGHELGFYPLNRTNLNGEEDPNLFAFLAFKTVLAPGIELLTHDKTDLNVSTSSDPNKIANAIICIIKERGQAIMKAGGCNALHVAMSAVINARRRLKRSHRMDLMLVPQWITEDTRSLLGRESKFLRMNILRSGLNGVSHNPHSALSPV